MLEDYLDMLARVNGLSDVRWVFDEGMGYGSTAKWWGDMGKRSDAHNGVDIRIYELANGTRGELTGYSIVPCATDGEVAAVIEDFLGQSVFIKHAESDIVIAYGHLKVSDNIKPGGTVKRGDVIGNISEYDGMPVPPHLHLSMLKASPDMDWSLINWQSIPGDDFSILDPMD